MKTRLIFVAGTNTNEIAYFEAVLQDVSASYCVDWDRVYATGHSNGGQMSYRLGIVDFFQQNSMFSPCQHVK